MDFDASPRQFTPDDPDAADRMERLRALKLETRPYAVFDELAAELATTAGAPDGYAMVNFIGLQEQFFAGLYTPGATPGSSGGQSAVLSAAAQPGRVMDRDHGFCPHVVVRRRALVLEDVCDYPRFKGNPVVDKLGIRSYLGAPLIDPEGRTLGTMCVVATDPHPWGHRGLEIVKTMANRVVDQMLQVGGRA